MVIEFLIISLLLVFLTYGVVEYWVVTTQHQQASHLANKYLARMSIEGRLTSDDEDNLIEDFSNIGLEVKMTDIKAVNISDQVIRQKIDEDAIVTRNPQNATDSIMKLTITGKPKVEPIWIGGLIKSDKTENTLIKVGGEVISEKPN